MSTLTSGLDLKQYGKLLAKAAPQVIKTEAENERMLAVVEALMSKGEDKLSSEEDALLELLADLIHDYEAAAFAVDAGAPAVAALSGQCEISREQASRQGVFFRVRPELFRR